MVTSLPPRKLVRPTKLTVHVDLRVRVSQVSQPVTNPRQALRRACSRQPAPAAEPSKARATTCKAPEAYPESTQSAVDMFANSSAIFVGGMDAAVYFGMTGGGDCRVDESKQS